MIFLVDGYNFLFSYSESRGDLEQSRQGALKYLSERLSAFNYPVSVVFDAYKTKSIKSCIDYENLEVIYTSHNQSADDYILEQVDLSSCPAQITAVTNDRKLKREVVSLGGEILSFSQFFKRVQKKRSVNNSNEKSDQMSKADFERYEKEFKKRL